MYLLVPAQMYPLYTPSKFCRNNRLPRSALHCPFSSLPTLLQPHEVQIIEYYLRNIFKSFLLNFFLSTWEIDDPSLTYLSVLWFSIQTEPVHKHHPSCRHHRVEVYLPYHIHHGMFTSTCFPQKGSLISHLLYIQ